MAPENEPTIFLPLDGEDFAVTRENGSLWRFMGDLAMYDHAWVLVTIGDPESKDPEERVPRGLHIFKLIEPELYKTMATFMVRHKYPLRLNMGEVLPEDVAAYNDLLQTVEAEISDFMPEGWGSADPAA